MMNSRAWLRLLSLTAVVLSLAALACACGGGGGGAAPAPAATPSPTPTPTPPPPPSPPPIVKMVFTPIEFLSTTYRSMLDVDITVRDQSGNLLGTASGTVSNRRLTATAGVSNPANTDAAPWRDGTYFDLLASDGTVTQDWAWRYAAYYTVDGVFYHGGVRVGDPQRWWWDTAINYSDLTGTRYGIVRDWMPTIRTGQTFDYAFDLVARYENGSVAFTQINREKSVGAIEVVTIPIGRYEAYKVRTQGSRQDASSLWTAYATTEYWRPDMGLLKGSETIIETFDFITEQHSTITYEMTDYTP